MSHESLLPKLVSVLKLNIHKYAGGQYMTIDYTEFEFFTFSPNFVKSKFAYAECQRVYTSLDEDR